MSDDKLIKMSVSIETAEAFAKAVGRAIADNDVEGAKALSGELREKLEATVCACGHNRLAHSFTSNAELPNKPTGACLATIPVTLWQCSCLGFVPSGVCHSPSTGSDADGEPLRCTLPTGHQSEHRNERPNTSTFAWDNPEWSQSDKLANVSKQPFSTVPSLFAEGKHFCKLRRVYYATSRTGNPMVCFVLEVVKSRQIATGVEVIQALPVRTPTMANIVRGQLYLLGIDPTAINGMLDTLDIEVVTVVVKKWAKAKIDGSQREVTSWWMRRPDDTDVESDFE